jgi:phosphate ABC transporter permease protein PstC
MTSNEHALGAPVPSALQPQSPSGERGRAINLSAASSRDNEWLVRPILMAAALFSGLVVALVVGFVFWQAWPLWRAEGLKFLTSDGWDWQLENAWNSGGVFFGALPLLLGSVITTLGAVIGALVIGLPASIFLAELAPTWIRRPMETVVQLLAGIPSVVFGLVGLSVVVPFITDHIVPANAGEVVTEVPIDGACILAAIIVLSFMILPFFVTVATDSLRSVPRSFIDGGLALGMTRWRTITRLQVPSAAPGLIAGIVLAAARAIGEAIAVSMVAGALAFVPALNHGPLYALLMPVRTMASAIVESGAEASNVPAIASAMFALASVLLVFSLGLSLAARWAFVVFNRKMNIDTGRQV